MTAFVNKATVEKCRKAGMEGILYKPVSREGLMKQVSIFYNQNGPELQKVNTSDPHDASSSGPIGSIKDPSNNNSGSTIKKQGSKKQYVWLL